MFVIDLSWHVTQKSSGGPEKKNTIHIYGGSSWRIGPQTGRGVIVSRVGCHWPTYGKLARISLIDRERRQVLLELHPPQALWRQDVAKVLLLL